MEEEKILLLQKGFRHSSFSGLGLRLWTVNFSALLHVSICGLQLALLQFWPCRAVFCQACGQD